MDENGPVEIVDLPIGYGDFPEFVLFVPFSWE